MEGRERRPVGGAASQAGNHGSNDHNGRTRAGLSDADALSVACQQATAAKAASWTVIAGKLVLIALIALIARIA